MEINSNGCFPGWFQICFFMFMQICGEMIQFDEHIFQMGCNHQLDFFLGCNENMFVFCCQRR